MNWRILTARDLFEFYLMNLDSNSFNGEDIELLDVELWSYTGMVDDNILQNLDDKKHTCLQPDFFDVEDRPRLRLSTIAKALKIEQSELEYPPTNTFGNAKFRDAADFIRLTREKYAESQGEMRKMYLLAWNDFYEEAPEDLKNKFDEKFYDIFGKDLSDMQPLGTDENGDKVYSAEEVAKALGMPEKELIKSADELNGVGIHVSFTMPEAEDGKAQ